MSETVKFNIEGSLAVISLNRPDVFNSFNREMATALQEALDVCAENEEIRAVYLTGEGKAFCAGQDLQEAIDPEGPGIRNIVNLTYNPIIMRIRALDKPVICAVNGVAAGAGANIAFACDVVLASEKASFIQAFSKIGLIPDSGGTYFLPRLIGMQKAKALMMLGDKVSALDAEKLGMVYSVYPADTFVSESMKVATKLSQMPTKGLAYTKQLLNFTFVNSLEEQLAMEEDMQAAAGDTLDYKEGVQAFLEKRKPVFKGK